VSEHDCATHGWQSEQEDCPTCIRDPIAAYRQTYSQAQVDAIKDKLKRDLALAVLEAYEDAAQLLIRIAKLAGDKTIELQAGEQLPSSDLAIVLRTIDKMFMDAATQVRNRPADLQKQKAEMGKV
jgi:hypothetical protein